MIRASRQASRPCAYRECDNSFRPRDTRQLFCSPDHAQLERDARKRTTAPTPGIGRPRRDFVPVTRLLTAPCHPTRTDTLPVAPGSTKAGLDGESYGEVVRRVWCARYSECLAYAVSLRWEGFGCQECTVDAPDVNAPRNKRTNWEW